MSEAKVALIAGACVVAVIALAAMGGQFADSSRAERLSRPCAEYANETVNRTPVRCLPGWQP